jgi:hypothetical protein
LFKTNARAARGEAGFEVFCGIDVAREMHHAVALNGAGDRVVDRPLPNAEPDLMKLFEQLQQQGRVLVVVDQLASIGALAIAVARSRGIAVAYLPGLSMRMIADLYAGEGKTGARDAHIIADAARTLPHALRGVGPDEQTTVELALLAGYDADLADESTRLINRLHDALSHVHPSLERLLGKHFHCPVSCGCWPLPEPRPPSGSSAKQGSPLSWPTGPRGWLAPCQHGSSPRWPTRA